jgi:hypothetical protein
MNKEITEMKKNDIFLQMQADTSAMFQYGRSESARSKIAFGPVLQGGRNVRQTLRQDIQRGNPHTNLQRGNLQGDWEFQIILLQVHTSYYKFA